jgi:Flp pilus assembly protein TadG
MMLQRVRRLLAKFLRNENGQTLPVVALMMVVLLAMVGIVVDVGHVYLCHRELQSSSDAAALAAAEVIPPSNDPAAPVPSASIINSTALLYSSAPGGKNIYKNMSNVQIVSGYPKLLCLSTMQTQGISCVGPLQYNAVQVMQQATVNLNFAWIVGKPNMTITAAATAAKGGASSRPYNIALVLDTTLSETQYDSDCGNTQMMCTLQGVQILLNHLDPCGTSQTTCTVTSGQAANSVVRISLFTFPQMVTSTVSKDYDCSNNTPANTMYTFPVPTAAIYTPGSSSYRILDFQSDYRVGDTATTLNTASNITKAVGGYSGCNGIYPATTASQSNFYLTSGQYGTYYPATIYAAQSALTYEQSLYPDSQNVMIIIGDGNNTAPQSNNGQTVMSPTPYVSLTPGASTWAATALGVYPSWYGECSQSITAANYATAQGTRVYTVAYGSPSTGCASDQSGQGHATGAYPNVLPCNEMAQMASASYYFFSDFKQTGSGSVCTAAQVMIELSDIFLQIAGDLTVARLIPNSTT